MDVEEALKENQQLKKEIESCWQDLADSARDDAEYQASIRALREEVSHLRQQVLELQAIKEEAN